MSVWNFEDLWCPVTKSVECEASVNRIKRMSVDVAFILVCSLFVCVNDFLFLAARLVAYWPAPIHAVHPQPILSSRDFRQASSVLQPKAFYF